MDYIGENLILRIQSLMVNKHFQRVYLYIAFLLHLTIIFLVSAQAETIPSLCKITYPSDAQVEWECRRLLKGETLESLFGDRWVDVARFNRIDRRHVYPGIYIKVPKQLEDIKNYTPLPKYYHPAKSEAKFILVNLLEQFLGAYEYGHLVLSSPVATGDKGNETPTGEFKIIAIDSRHKSSLYFVEKTKKLYPMNYGLMFHVDKKGVAYWVHSRDLPGYPASHGCIGLYDEHMQKKYYGYPKEPVLKDSELLFNWVISPLTDDKKYNILKDGPKIAIIIGDSPVTISCSQ